jgi:hypothetical protein
MRSSHSDRYFDRRPSPRINRSRRSHSSSSVRYSLLSKPRKSAGASADARVAGLSNVACLTQACGAISQQEATNRGQLPELHRRSPLPAPRLRLDDTRADQAAVERRLRRRRFRAALACQLQRQSARTPVRLGSGASPAPLPPTRPASGAAVGRWDRLFRPSSPSSLYRASQPSAG